MNDAALTERLKAYGADIEGIDDRFMGDSALYISCFSEFLNEPSFAALKEAVAFREYEKAMEAAHALKGLAGNLGVTPFYNAVSLMVEDLRKGAYEKSDADYSALEREYARLKTLLSDAPPAEEAEPRQDAAPEKESAAGKKEKPPKKKTDKLIVTTLLALLASIAAVCTLFGGLMVNYRNNTVKENAAHLIEINQGIKLYVEAKLEADWNATHSIANSITSSNLGNDEDIFAYLLKEREIWNVTNITVYTESGYNVSTSGSVTANDSASEIAASAHKHGEYMTIQESDILYIVPTETDVEYHGSKIVAISVVQSLRSFLDNMHISSFDGAAYLYLTQSNGAVISRMTHPSAETVYNLLPLLRESEVRPLAGGPQSVDTLLSTEDTSVFLRETPEGEQYVVVSPIETKYDEMRLFYFVPADVVNQTTNSFSRYIVFLSVIVVLLCAAGATLVFVILYNARKKQFDEAMILREHMLDLLVQKSNAAFALLTTVQSAPRFASSNVERITGEPCHNIRKTDSGYRMCGADGSETDMLQELNAQMTGWDGKSDFRSGFILNRAAEKPVYFELQIFPIEEGEFVAIAQDVTPLYERQAAAEEALEMAEQANCAKSRFLSNMSHDIRTPMNAIVNMTDFAKESMGEPEKQAEYLNQLGESANHLLQIINDVLDMSRIESGRMVIASNPFNLSAELDRLADIIRPLCESRQQTFISDFSRVQDDTVLGDQVKLAQILLNLLSNANKFTPAGGSVRFIAEEIPALRANMVTMRFCVVDTGIGIAQENLKTIFEPFARVKDERVDRIEGTGLGLSICYSYVTAMGGTIRCESAPGKGSTFTVELFFRTAEAAPEAKHSHAAGETALFAGRRCLVCEDHPVNQKIAARLLQQLGFLVETASDGAEGVGMFCRSQAGYYDVIYMDIQMPEMDGYQAAEAIRASGHANARTVPIIAMTANVFAEDIEKARAAGMNGHLGKPILVPELIETTNQVLNNNGGESK